MGLLHHPFWLQHVFGTFWTTLSNILDFFVWLRITDEGSEPAMRIWSILLIESDLKWWINLSRSLYLYMKPECGLAPTNRKTLRIKHMDIYMFFRGRIA